MRSNLTASLSSYSTNEHISSPSINSTWGDEDLASDGLANNSRNSRYFISHKYLLLYALPVLNVRTIDVYSYVFSNGERERTYT